MFLRIRAAVVGFVVALALSATAGYAVQDFTLDEAQTRIERLEAHVSSLEATIAAGFRWLLATMAGMENTATRPGLRAFGFAKGLRDVPSFYDLSPPDV
jgi:CHASE1-domain containing sensor protein